eukprot:2746-Heterococcus_DN1.PRE.2
MSCTYLCLAGILHELQFLLLALLWLLTSTIAAAALARAASLRVLMSWLTCRVWHRASHASAAAAALCFTPPATPMLCRCRCLNHNAVAKCTAAFRLFARVAEEAKAQFGICEKRLLFQLKCNRTLRCACERSLMNESRATLCAYVSA